MIILKATSETITITTTTAANIDYSVSYADITTTTFAPSTNEGTMTSGTATLVPATSSGSTQRQVKFISISNRHATLSNTVVVKKLITATNYNLTPTVTLLAGEAMEYVDGQGWICYSATGAIKSNQTAAGSNKQIQFNSNGILAGDADLTFDASTNDIIFAGTDANLTMTGITNEPAAPSAGNLTLYTKAVSGRMMPKWVAPSGVDTAFQPSLGFNTVYLWTPATTTGAVGTGFGCTWPSCTTTITHPNVTAGMGNQIKVMQCNNTNVANQVNGLVASTATLANVWVGSAVGQGGFFFQCRWKIMVFNNTACRIFVGLASTGSNSVVSSDTYTGDLCGFDHITTDNITTMSFATMNNVTRSRATFTVPTLAAGNAYDATIYCPPNSTYIYYRLVDLLTGTVLVDTSTNSNIPRNTIFMGVQVTMSPGTAVTTAGAFGIGINKVYLECDM